MAGFSSDWLRLREPADTAARNGTLLGSVAAFKSDAKSLMVLDLGAGTGSTLRALAPHLRTPQRWVLVDHDASLVAAGRQVLAAWAASAAAVAAGERPGSAGAIGGDPAAHAEDGALALHVGTQPVTVSWRQADLADADWPALLAGVDLVTASALFDLVSETFIEAFAAAVAHAGAAVYVALDVDGTSDWSPAHADDAAVAAAFRRHQGIDKGFGRALGPEATAMLARALAAHGYHVRTQKSPWRLGPEQAELMSALAEGWADAAGAAGLDAAVVDRWLTARRTATGCVIGHTDLFATPPRR
jgi:SAM-dependent methyltransferase